MVTQVTTANFSNATLTALTSPTITSITVTNSSYVPTGETAVSLSGGYVTVVGSSFVSGATVYIDSTPATAVTFVNSTQLNVQVPGLVSNSYIVYVINLDGSVAIRVNGINYSANPTWVTSGTQGFSSGTISLQLVASSDSTIIYTVASGSSLPAGLTLSSSGLLSGTVTGTGIVTYNFSVVATDVETQQSTQAFSITITFSDAYWNSVTLLLNGETPVTSFITDASTNNFNSTIAGDTRPTPFIPYQNGYYSNYLDGTGDYLTPPGSDVFAVGTGDFTIEYWVYALAGTNNYMFQVSDTVGGIKASAVNSLGMNLYTNGTVYIYANNTTYGPSANNRLPYYTWTHFAIVRSSSVTKLYINGQLETTLGTAGSITDTTNYTGTYPVIGVGYGSGFSWNGYISNFRIIKGTAVYTSNFTPSTSPLTAITNTSILTCQSNRLIDTSVNNFAITKNGDTTVTQFNPFGIPTSTTVNNRYSTYFDGTGDYLSVPYTSTLYFGSGDFTVEFWWYPPVTYTSTQGPCIGFGYKLSPQTGGWVIYRNTGSNTDKISIRLAIQGGFPGVVDFATASTPVANVWAHWAIVRIGTTLTWYKNGVVDATTTNSTNITDTDTTTLGYVGYAQQWGYLAQGNLSNVRIVKGIGVYTTAFTPPTSPLTATQSANVNGNPSAAISGSATSLLTCQDSTLIDNSTNVFPITSYGDARPISVSPLTQTTTSVALTTLGGTYFDGTGDYLSIPYNTQLNLSSGDFTIEAWVYWTGINATPEIINKDGVAGSSYPSYALAIASNKITFSVGSGNGVGYLQTITPASTTFPTNTWTHVAAVKSGTTLTVYQNGVNVISATQSGTIVDGGKPLLIGYQTGQPSSSNWAGYISNSRIVKGTALYTSNFAPPVQPLTAVTNTSLLTLQYNGGANNSGIIDNSSFNNIITRFGNTSQGTFSPYGSNWSNYFPATGNYLYGTNSNFQVGGSSTVWTIEMWIYPLTETGWYNFVIGSGGPYGNSLLVGFISNRFTLGQSTGSASGGIGINSTNTYTANAWYHVAGTKNSSGLATLYVNGVLAGTQTYVGGLAGGTTFVVNGVYDNNGLGNSGGQFYTQDVRLIIGTALGTGSTYPVPTAPLTAINGTVLLTCQSAGFVDNGPLAVAISVGGTPVAQRFSKFAQVIQTPLSYSGYFDGTGDYLSTPSSVSTSAGWNLMSPSATGTFEAWVYRTFSDTRRIIAGCLDIGATYTGWYISMNTTGTINVEGYISGNNVPPAIISTGAVDINTWAHVAVTCVNGAITFYINGVNSGTGTMGATWQVSTSTATPTYVGNAYTPWNIMFMGSLSNVRMVKGVAVYTGNFTVPTTPLTATQTSGTNISAITGVQTSLLTCQSTTFIDNSTNNFTITAFGNTVPRTFNPFGVTNNTNQSYTPALYGGSGYFDGTTDYLTVPRSTLYRPGASQNFTIEAWVYSERAAGVTAQQIMGFHASGVSSDWILYISSSNYPIFYIDAIGTSITSSIIVNPYSWNHIAVVRKDTNNITLYVNGVVGGTATSTSTLTGSGANPLSIGSDYNGVNYVTKGYISNGRIVNGTALYTSNFVPPSVPLTTYSNTTPAVLLTNFTSGGVIDYHMNNVLETVGNAQLNTNVKQFGNASISFDGTGDYLKGPISPVNQIGSGDYTFECWVYANSLAASKPGEQTLITYGANGFLISIWTGNVHLAQDNVADKTDWASASVTNTTWFYLAVCRSGVSTRCFVNGVQAGSTYTDSTNYTGTTSIYLGANGAGTTAFNGYMDEIRITKFARYTSTPFPVPTSAFQTI